MVKLHLRIQLFSNLPFFPEAWIILLWYIHLWNNSFRRQHFPDMPSLSLLKHLLRDTKQWNRERRFQLWQQISFYYFSSWLGRRQCARTSRWCILPFFKFSVSFLYNITIRDASAATEMADCYHNFFLVFLTLLNDRNSEIL